jgi:hypothetical protein
VLLLGIPGLRAQNTVVVSTVPSSIFLVEHTIHVLIPNISYLYSVVHRPHFFGDIAPAISPLLPIFFHTPYFAGFTRCQKLLLHYTTFVYSHGICLVLVLGMCLPQCAMKVAMFCSSNSFHSMCWHVSASLMPFFGPQTYVFWEFNLQFSF